MQTQPCRMRPMGFTRVARFMKEPAEALADMQRLSQSL
jgi:hypothetical protein